MTDFSPLIEKWVIGLDHQNLQAKGLSENKEIKP